jgi:hypothetical protein
MFSQPFPAFYIEGEPGMPPRTRASAVATASFAIFVCACEGKTPPSAPTRVVPIPTLTAISPDVGSTSGDTPIVITGTGFEDGLTVTFGGVPATVRFDARSTDRLRFPTPPHAAGWVDVVVSNIGGQPARFDAGYTYAVPESFDFNGTWWGFPTDGSDLPLEFAIQNSGLVRASCDASVVTFSPPLPLTNGAFSFSRDGSTMTGKIVSASQAVGAIAFAPCHAEHWEATRKP